MDKVEPLTCKPSNTCLTVWSYLGFLIDHQASSIITELSAITQNRYPYEQVATAPWDHEFGDVPTCALPT